MLMRPIRNDAARAARVLLVAVVLVGVGQAQDEPWATVLTVAGAGMAAVALALLALMALVTAALSVLESRAQHDGAAGLDD